MERALTVFDFTFTFARALIGSKRIGTRRLNRKFERPETAIISSMEAERLREEDPASLGYEDVFRFYRLAKRAEWAIASSRGRTAR